MSIGRDLLKNHQSQRSFDPKDHFFRKAKAENFAARSVYKLQEIDERWKLLRPSDQVLDLGASPGSWSQYSAQRIGPRGRVLGIDLSPVSLKIKNASFVQADLRDVNFDLCLKDLGFGDLFDVVLSDMAPNTTGIRSVDQDRSFSLCEMALEVAEKHLKKSGNFVCKYFHSSDFKTLHTRLSRVFHRVEALKPESTRKISKEIFLIGLNKK